MADTIPDIIKSPQGHWINGAWSTWSGASIAVENPSTGQQIAKIPAGTAADVDQAVASARAAYPAWRALAVPDRAALLDKVADELEARADDIATLIATDMGMPVKLARLIQTNLPIASFRTAARLARDFDFVRPIGNSRVFMEPVGVVGCITPWNYPLHQIAAKVAFALAAGCTVVLKPSEVAPLCVMPLIEATRLAGLPAGIFNVIWGTGPDAGQRLAESAGVDLLSFTGSTQTGRKLSVIGAQSLKRISLELGGKSPSIVLPGAAFEKAVKASTSNCFVNSGQTCSAWTRLLVERKDLAQAEAIARAVAEKMTPADPFDPASRMGPLVSALQKSRVMDFIAKGKAEGATLIAGGGTPANLPSGYFVDATVFSNVTPTMTIAQEEIFGPVLAIMPYDSVDEAIEIANGTPYGLAAAVWGEDHRAAEIVARRIDSGQIDLNGGRFNPLAPFGGFKASGHGRENGPFGLEEFTEPKALQY
jgi:aldehyde dehydrogenase (NAD+)